MPSPPAASALPPERQRRASGGRVHAVFGEKHALTGERRIRECERRLVPALGDPLPPGFDKPPCSTSIRIRMCLWKSYGSTCIFPKVELAYTNLHRPNFRKSRFGEEPNDAKPFFHAVWSVLVLAVDTGPLHRYLREVR